MSLAAPCNENQNEELLQLLNSGSYDRFWLGISDITNEGQWMEINSQALEGEKLIIYENWNPGEPNGGTTTNCAQMRQNWNGHWNDVNCEENSAFVCEVLT